MFGKKTILCVHLLFGSIMACHGVTVSERVFLWNEANAAMLSADSKEGYLEAARVYQDMVDKGVRNGPVFYNMGTALLNAGFYDEATAAFLRAERYMGSHPDLAQNLAIAVMRAAGTDKLQAHWYRIPLFWHFRLSTPARTMLAAIIFSLFWLLLALRRTIAPRGTKIPAAVLILIFVLLGSSIATSLHQEAGAKRFVPALHAPY